MIVNWVVYINNMLLVLLRKPRMVAFLKVLLNQTQKLNDDLDSYINSISIPFGSWQTCMLERLLQIEFVEEDIWITEGDGQPIDFIVHSNSYIPTNSIRGFVNRHKLEGKSFFAEFPNVTYEVKWGDYVCEKTDGNNTGYERGQTIKIVKTESSETVSDTTYNITNEFFLNGMSFVLLTQAEFQSLSLDDYNARLASFKQFIQNVEYITDIESKTVTGYESRRENLIVCPI